MRIGITGIGVRAADSVLTEKKALIVGNKLDLPVAQQNFAALQVNTVAWLWAFQRKPAPAGRAESQGISVTRCHRVYTKAGTKGGYDRPHDNARGSTVEDAAEAVHKDFRAKLKYARLWGSGNTMA